MIRLLRRKPVALGTGVTAMGHDSYDNAAIARWVADSAVWMKGIR